MWRGALIPRKGDAESVSRGEGTPPTPTAAFARKLRNGDKVELVFLAGGDILVVIEPGLAGGIVEEIHPDVVEVFALYD